MFKQGLSFVEDVSGALAACVCVDGLKQSERVIVAASRRPDEKIRKLALGPGTVLIPNIRMKRPVSTTKIRMMIFAVARMFCGDSSAAFITRKLHTYVDLNTPSWDKQMNRSNEENGPIVRLPKPLVL